MRHLPFFLLVLLNAAASGTSIDPWTLQRSDFATPPGYVSSYQPLKDGHLITDETPLENPWPKIFLFDQNPMNLLQRFIRASQNIGQFPQDENVAAITQFFTKNLYNQKAEPWEGQCHKWAAASSDRQINQWLSGGSGLICGNIYLKDQELRELFTSFYEDEGVDYFGVRRSFIGSDNVSEKLYQDVLQHLGFSYLPPHIMHQRLVNQLAEGKGVVMNVDYSEKIWNQPVFRYIFEREEVLHSFHWPLMRFTQWENRDFDDEDPNVEDIPLYQRIQKILKDPTRKIKNFDLLVAKNRAAKHALTLVDSLDDFLEQLFVGGFFSNQNAQQNFALEDRIKQLKIQLSTPLLNRIRLWFLEHPTEGLFAQIRALMDLRQNLLSEADWAGLRLKKGVKIFRYTGHIYYSEEMHYRTDRYAINADGWPYRLGTEETDQPVSVAELPYRYPTHLPVSVKDVAFYVVQVKQEKGPDLYYSRWVDSITEKKSRIMGSLWLPKHFDWQHLREEFQNLKHNWSKILKEHDQLELDVASGLSTPGIPLKKREKMLEKKSDQMHRLALGQLAGLFDYCYPSKGLVTMGENWQHMQQLIEEKLITPARGRSWLKTWKKEYSHHRDVPWNPQLIDKLVPATEW